MVCRYKLVPPVVAAAQHSALRHPAFVHLQRHCGLQHAGARAFAATRGSAATSGSCSSTAFCGVTASGHLPRHGGLRITATTRSTPRSAAPRPTASGHLRQHSAARGSAARGSAARGSAARALQALRNNTGHCSDLRALQQHIPALAVRSPPGQRDTTASGHLRQHRRQHQHREWLHWAFSR